ncbi:hypothetical protein KGM_202908 [Danaus plexippus plexippus]|uniref:Uncharacterized protein n=1 Tax=Danaus plexippus plexippus TaxID=278856 RepID=A0A212F3V3_DANPL|nr:hypothetical protein KGM_202908 [Danaus plexippus plexippus]
MSIIIYSLALCGDVSYRPFINLYKFVTTIVTHIGKLSAPYMLTGDVPTTARKNSLDSDLNNNVTGAVERPELFTPRAHERLAANSLRWKCYRCMLLFSLYRRFWPNRILEYVEGRKLPSEDPRRASDLAAGECLCALAFTDEVDHLIKLFLLVVEVQGLHAALEVGRREAFRPAK